MKLKLAVIALIASMTLSCDTSFGCDLLDRMLGRAGCSSCEAPIAPSCGCGGGLMDKIVRKSAGCGCCGSDMLTYDANMSCGPVASDCGCEAPVADCGCETSAPACGGGGCGLLSKLGGRGCGCDAPVADCGCSAPAPVADCGCSAPAPVADCGCGSPEPVADCGCEAPAHKSCFLGLFNRSKKADCGCDAPVADCGCEAAPAPVVDCGCSAPAPVADCGCGEPAPVADCGCDAPAKPSCSLGLFNRFKKSDCGCDAPVYSAPAPVADCGCSAPAPVADCGCGAPAPVADCGCEAPAHKSCFLGLFNRSKATDCGCGAPVADCGCEAAPVPVSDCGCGSAAPAISDCGCSAPAGGCGGGVATCGHNGVARGKLSLMDRLRGNRIPRTREGVVIGSACNDGCNPPCPNQPAAGCGCGAAAPVYQEAAPCTSCGGGEVIYSDAQPSSGCTSCGDSQGQIIYGDATAAPVTSMQSQEANVDPVVPSAGGGSGSRNATEGVIEAGDGNSEASPVVDPGAFVPRKNTTVGS